MPKSECNTRKLRASEAEKWRRLTVSTVFEDEQLQQPLVSGK